MLPLSVELVMKSCAELSDPLGYLLLQNKKRTLIQKKKNAKAHRGVAARRNSQNGATSSVAVVKPHDGRIASLGTLK